MHGLRKLLAFVWSTLLSSVTEYELGSEPVGHLTICLHTCELAFSSCPQACLWISELRVGFVEPVVSLFSFIWKRRHAHGKRKQFLSQVIISEETADVVYIISTILFVIAFLLDWIRPAIFLEYVVIAMYTCLLCLTLYHYNKTSIASNSTHVYKYAFTITEDDQS